MATCGECGGATVVLVNCQSHKGADCVVCGGTGLVTVKCPTCRGTGEV